MIAILEKTEHNIDFHQIVDFIKASHIRQYSRKATRIALSKALSPAADEPASLSRDDSQGEAFPTVSSLDAGQDRENIIKTSALPHESSPRVTSLDAEEGKEEVRVERSTELGRNDTEEMVNVLSAMEAANILTSGVAAVSVSPVAVATTVGVPTVSGLVPTVSVIFTTASVVTPYSRRPREISAKDKGKEKVVESDRLSEQLARDSEIARLYAEDELKMMIEGLDKSNEMFAKHLQEYEQAATDLTIGEKIKLINELVKYQDHHAKILKYQAQQSKPLSKKEQREFYMSVLRSHVGWKTRHFIGMTLEEIKEKFIPVWKQIEDFVPMSSKEKGERMKRKGLKLDQGSSKRMKTYVDVSEEVLKGMMQLVPVEEATHCLLANTMADMNIPVNNALVEQAPAEQAPAIAPQTRTNDQILPLSNWVPIGKINCILNVQKFQRNHRFLIVVALLKNTNFFRAFTASSMIPAIYIQQFWDTMCFNTSTELYSCQLDEKWSNLHKDLLRDALDITLTNDNNPFVAPPSSDTVIEYVNTLGYPSTLRNVSAMSINALYQPWRAILSMINMCLTQKTAGYDRPRYPVPDSVGKNLATASHEKKKTAHLLILSVRYVGKDGREIFDAVHGKVEEGEETKSVKSTKVTKPKATKVTKQTSDPKPKHVPTQPSKAILEKKQKLV
nr:hypothetical protein [Tanacetum cinerariifolium]